MTRRPRPRRRRGPWVRLAALCAALAVLVACSPQAPPTTRQRASWRAEDVPLAVTPSPLSPRSPLPRRRPRPSPTGRAAVTAGTERNRRSLAKVLGNGLGDIRLADLSPLHVERFKRARLAEEAAPATVNRAVAMLKHACKLFATWEWLSRETAAAIRGVPMLAEPPGRVRCLTAEEEARLIVALPETFRPVAQVALLTGMRLGELIGLRKDDLDLLQGVATLTRTKTNRVRRVYLNADALPIVREVAERSPCAHVFASRLGRPYTSGGATRIAARAIRRAGLTDCRFHDLRHTCATRLRAAGAGLDVIAGVLGHSTVTMAARYAHVSEAALRSAMATLPPPAEPALAGAGSAAAAGGRGASRPAPAPSPSLARLVSQPRAKNGEG